MGQSAEWWREYRAKNRERLNEQTRQRRLEKPRDRGDRSAEYAKRPSRVLVGDEPLPLLYPGERHGQSVSFREDEIRMDAMQERALAVLEGRDPDKAADELWARERVWMYKTASWVDEQYSGDDDDDMT